jgi:hypothetical protein
MLAPTILIASLCTTQLTSQPSQPPIARAEVEVADDTVHLIAFDRDGEVAAEVVQWQLDGESRIDAVFPDGLAMTIDLDGEEVTIISDDPDEAISRLALIEDLLAETDQAGKGNSLECWGHLTLTVIHCATANVPFCILGAAATVCECEDEEDFEC